MPKAVAELWRRKLFTNRQPDAQNEANLVSEGWKVLRSWEHGDPADARSAGHQTAGWTS